MMVLFWLTVLALGVLLAAVVVDFGGDDRTARIITALARLGIGLAIVAPVAWAALQRFRDGFASDGLRANLPTLGILKPQIDSVARSASLIATVAVVIGFADLPYGYYTVLHLALCGISLFLAWGAKLKLEDWHRWVLGGFAVLYNPLVPIQISDKPIWAILNIATVAFFWVISVQRSAYLTHPIDSPPADGESIVARLIAEERRRNAPLLHTGTISRLLIEKGFGFIRGKDAIEHFFHRSSVRGAVFELLREGQRVEFVSEESQHGPCANDVRLIETPVAPSHDWTPNRLSDSQRYTTAPKTVFESYRLAGPWHNGRSKARLEIAIAASGSVSGWFNVNGDIDPTRVDGALNNDQLDLKLSPVKDQRDNDSAAFGLSGRFDGHSFLGNFTIDSEPDIVFELRTVQRELIERRVDQIWVKEGIN